MRTNRDIGCPPRFMNRADLAVVLGSGLSPAADLLDRGPACRYDSISGLVRPRAPGHEGLLLLRTVGEQPVLLFSGRSHLYEGHDPLAAGAAVSAAAALGCRSILLTQAAGGLHRSMSIGSWLVARDVVSFPVRSGMRSFHMEDGSYTHSGGPFIDISLRGEVERAVLRAGIQPVGGILFWAPGPCYETAAEARAARMLGADAANMSCLPELVAARRTGIRAACLSLITNHTANYSGPPSDHDEIVRCGGRASASLARILVEFVSGRAGRGGKSG